MRNLLKALCLFMIAPFFAMNVQGQEFKEKDMVLNFGLGLGTALYAGSYYSMTLPPLSMSFEYGIKEGVGPGVIGIGGYLGIAGSKYEETYGTVTYGYKYHYTVLGLRGAYHLVDVADKLDLYGGLMLGYSVTTYKEIGNHTGLPGSPDASRPTYSFFLGARYYLTPKFALMGELGYGVSYLNIGVALKLK